MTTTELDPHMAALAARTAAAFRAEQPAPAIIDRTAVIAQMRAAGRIELIHYAVAAHRDRVAWHLCAAYLADPQSSEADLKECALLACGWSARDARAVGDEHRKLAAARGGRS